MHLSYTSQGLFCILDNRREQCHDPSNVEENFSADLPRAKVGHLFEYLNILHLPLCTTHWKHFPFSQVLDTERNVSSTSSVYAGLHTVMCLPV